MTPTPDWEDLAEAVYQTVGAASVCWDEMPVGIFDERRATEIADDLVQWLIRTRFSGAKW